MKNNLTKRITINNELPDLINAICQHPDCEDWLRDAIWDAFNNQNQGVVYSLSYWNAVVEMVAVGRANYAAYRANVEAEQLEVTQ